MEVSNANFSSKLDVSSANVSGKLDELLRDTKQLLELVKTQQPISTNSAALESETQVKTNLIDYAQATEKMVSSAATIISSRSVFGYSQFGSEFGVGLTDQKWDEILEWISFPVSEN